jgi:DNA-binding XRE family transcriptional regulator
MNRRGTTLKEFLRKQLRNQEFRRAYAEEDLPATLAVRIAMLRESRGMTQGALARRLHVSQQALSLLENPAKANFTLRTLQRVAAALKKDLVVEFR